MRAVLLVVVLAACDAGAPAAPAPAVPPAPRDARPADARVDAPIAVVPADAEPPSLLDRLFADHPAAVTKDGSTVLLKIVDADGARGAPNLAIELRDRHDRVIGSRVVVIPLDGDLDAPTHAQRMAEVERLIGSRTFVDVTDMERVDVNDLAPDHERFKVNDTTIDYEPGHFTVRRGGKIVVRRETPHAWRGSSYFDKGLDLTCSNPDFLRNAYLAPDAHLAVFDVAYRGNDSCWEPTNELHVVAW